MRRRAGPGHRRRRGLDRPRRSVAPKSLKLAAAKIFASEAAHLPHRPGCGYGPIEYREYCEVGELQFHFYNGAMSSDNCKALLNA